MTGETDLGILLASMTPSLDPTRYVFTHLAERDWQRIATIKPVGVYIEKEGPTLILSEDQARLHHLTASEPMCCITLNVHSSLEAVGLTAAVSNELAKLGISANIIAAFFHDHVFVPASHAHAALEALHELSDRARHQATQG